MEKIVSKIIEHMTIIELEKFAMCVLDQLTPESFYKVVKKCADDNDYEIESIDEGEVT